MKLWQKIFLCTMALVMLSIGVTSTAVLTNHFNLMISREMEQAVSEHNYLAAGITNRVLYQRLEEDKAILSRQELQEVVNYAVFQQSNLMVTTLSGEPFSSAMPDQPELPEAFLQSLAGNTAEGCQSYITDTQPGLTQLFVGSELRLEGEDLLLISFRDVSDLYELRSRQLQFVQILSVFFAVASSLVLLVMVFRLLSPLNRINRMVTGIAEGDYSLRLPEEGSVELRGLSHNINTMAASVEENVEQIQMVSEGRKQFIDNLAHEMKTPLTSILGFADLLRIKRTVSDKQRREFSGIIVEEARRLQSLSGKLMELAVMNNTSPDWEEIDLRELFHEILLATKPLLARRELTLRCVCPQVSLSADKELLKSLLHNLIDNASKASDPGKEILLLCRETPESLILSVSDQGIGMDPQTVKKAMEPFYMADKSRSRKKGSSGLGLALCARIAEIHGAELKISSKLGQGTTVFAIFPKATPGQTKGGQTP